MRIRFAFVLADLMDSCFIYYITYQLYLDTKQQMRTYTYFERNIISKI